MGLVQVLPPALHLGVPSARPPDWYIFIYLALVLSRSRTCMFFRSWTLHICAGCFCLVRPISIRFRDGLIGLKKGLWMHDISIIWLIAGSTTFGKYLCIIKKESLYGRRTRSSNYCFLCSAARGGRLQQALRWPQKALAQGDFYPVLPILK